MTGDIFQIRCKVCKAGMENKQTRDVIDQMIVQGESYDTIIQAFPDLHLNKANISTHKTGHISSEKFKAQVTKTVIENIVHNEKIAVEHVAKVAGTYTDKMEYIRKQIDLALSEIDKINAKNELTPADHGAIKGYMGEIRGYLQLQSTLEGNLMGEQDSSVIFSRIADELREEEERIEEEKLNAANSRTKKDSTQPS